MKFPLTTFGPLKTIAALGLICGIARADYVLYSTGEVLNGLQDLQYQIVSDTTGNNGASKQFNNAYAFTGNFIFGFASQPSGWAAQGGSLWVGPSPDQTNATRGATSGSGCNTAFAGSTVYKLQFQLTAAEVAGADIYGQVLADDSVVISANGTNIPISGPANFSTPGTIHLNAQTGLVASPATNAITFTVTNACGPTGLNVSWYGALGVTTAFGGSTASGTKSYSIQSLTDPVDSSSGVYRDSAVDLSLGGPMHLAFKRFHSTDFWKTGQQPAMGVNWMSNFDLELGVSGNTANVLMFGGRTVTFGLSGGAWQLQSPTDIVYQLVPSGSNYKFLDPVSRLVYTFAPGGVLLRIEDRNGNALTVAQGPFGPTTVSDGLGRVLTFTYTNGQLTKVQDQTGRAFTYGYNARTLVTVTDDLGHTTTYNYITVTGREAAVISTELPRGNVPNSQTYDSKARVISQTDGNKNTTTLAYDGNGGTTITDPMGKITKQVSDSHGDVSSQTDPGGVSQTLTLDSTNRRTGVTNGMGGHASYLYHSQTGYPLTETDAAGNTKTYSYTAQTANGVTFYNLSGIKYADNTSEGFTFDNSGNVLTHTAQDGAVTTQVYDGQGRVITRTNPDGSALNYTWNASGTLASETDAAGNKTTYSYDSLGRLAQSTDANGGISLYTHGAMNDTSRTFSSKTPGTAAVNLTYDFNGQLQDLATSVGGVFHFTRTPTDKLASSSDPLKNVTTFLYDADDHPSQKTDPTGVVTSYAYDSGNRLQSVSSAAGPTSLYTYTAANQIASVADGLGNKTLLGYDASTRLTSITSPSGSVSTLTYDKVGRLFSATDALGGSVTQGRDATGRIIQITERGNTTFVTYNALGLMSSLASANGNKWTYQYDAAGRQIQVTDPLGNSIKSTYTGTRRTQATLPLGTVTFTNDADGRVTKRLYSDGTVLNTGYDASGALISADNVSFQRDLAGQMIKSNGIGIAYDGGGRVASVTYAAGKTVTYGYDSSARLISVTDWVSGKTALGYDAASRLTSIAYPNGATNTYTYDADNQIAGIAFGNLGTIALTRDAAGKITSATRALPRVPVLTNASSQNNTYDAAGQLIGATYDKLGRVTSQSARTYNWNLASQLTSFHDGASAESYTYDGLGLLNTMTSGSLTQSFVMNYQFAYPALSVIRTAGQDLRYFVYLPNGNLLYSVEAVDNSRRFYDFDEMGNTVMLTNDGGTLTDTYAITPYGEIADHVGTTDNPFTWQGQFGVFQEGTGLYNMRARHYDASTARFISRDALQSADPANSEPYAYAAGNPLRNVDPLGRASGPLAGFVAGVVQGVEGFLNAAGNFISQAAAAAQGWIQSVVTPHLPPCVSDCPFYQAPQLPDEQQGVPFVPVDSGVATNAPLNPTTPSAKTLPASGASQLNWHLNANNILVDASGKVVSNDGGSFASGLEIARAGSLIQLTDGSEFLVGKNGSLISQDGSGLVIPLGPGLIPSMPAMISQDGSGLISQDGSSLISEKGGGLISEKGNGIVSEKGNGIVSDMGNGLISEKGGGVISNDGGSVISNDGGSVAAPVKPAVKK